MGILSSKIKLSDVERKVGVSRLARRRLGVVMTRLGMAENVTAAVKFVEQGHVRVGTEVVTDAAFLVVSILHWSQLCSNEGEILMLVCRREIWRIS